MVCVMVHVSPAYKTTVFPGVFRQVNGVSSV